MYCSAYLTSAFLCTLFMYVDHVFNERKKHTYYFLHFIPALTIFLLLLPFYFSTTDLKLYHSRMIKYLFIDISIIPYFIMAHMSIYAIMLINKVSFQKRVGHINTWLLAIIAFFAFYIICYISYYIMVTQSWFSLSHDYFVSLGMCASIVTIIYMSYARNKIMDGFNLGESLRFENISLSFREPPIDSSFAQKKKEGVTFDDAVTTSAPEVTTLLEPVLKIKEEAKYKNSGLTDDALEELASSLDRLMKKEQLYREGELKLEVLADRLGVARHAVSQVINQVYGVNFFEFINLLRIEEAKRLLSSTDKKEMNIIDVAYTIGYNTKNTFNTAFKRITGITPTAFRNQFLLRSN